MTLLPAALLKYLLHHQRRRLHDELMLVLMNPFLKLVQVLILPTLNLPHQDRLTPVHLVDDVVNHDACAIVFEPARLEVLIRPLNGTGAIIFPCNMLVTKPPNI